MQPEDCTNPVKPCHLHDSREEWRIEMAGRTVHSGWLVAAFVLIVVLSTGFN